MITRLLVCFLMLLFLIPGAVLADTSEIEPDECETISEETVEESDSEEDTSCGCYREPPPECPGLEIDREDPTRDEVKE